MHCKHEWEPTQRSGREKCRLCGTTYPCAGDCQHLDCRVDKGQVLPEWVTYKNDNKETT